MLRKQRKLQPWRRFGYVILIIIKFDFLQEFWMVWGAISNIGEGVSSAAPRFFNHFSVFRYRMKHFLVFDVIYQRLSWAPRCTGEVWYLWEGANALSQLVFWYLYPFTEKREWSRRLYVTQYTRKILFNSFVSFLFTLFPTAGSDLFTTVRIKHSTSETFWSFHVVTDLFCSFLIISSFSFHPFSLPSFLFYPLRRLLQQPSLVSFPAVSSRTMSRRKFPSK